MGHEASTLEDSISSRTLDFIQNCFRLFFAIHFYCKAA